MDKKDRELQLTTEVAKGLEAKSLVDNPIFKEVIENLEASYIGAIRSGNWFKKRAREENCRRLQVLDDLTVQIKHMVLTGEQAQKRLEANNGTKQRR